MSVKAYRSSSCHALFHSNMIILLEFNKPSKDLIRCFKEGMFIYANKDGFIQVSYFLLKIIYPNTKAFRYCWPILDRTLERDFRQAVCKLMCGLNNDFADIIQFPEVGPGKLMSPGGDRFAMLMWKLSLLAMGVQAKRDMGCYLLQQPSGKISPALIKSSINIRKMVTEENIAEIEKVESSFESSVNQFREMREARIGKIFELRARMKDLEINLKELDQYDLDYDLKKKLLDLNNEEGISVLDEKVSEKKRLIEEQFKCLKKSGDVVRDWKRITETIANQEVLGPEFVLDGLCLNDDEISTDILTSKFFKAYADVPEDNNKVSLLNHLSEPCEKLKSLKLDIHITDSQLHFEEWDRVCKERQDVESEFLKLEAELNRKVSELSACCNQEIFLPVEGQRSIVSTSILKVQNVIYASTPIKNKMNPSSDGKPANITPYQQPSNDDYFTKKLKENLANKVVNSSVSSLESKVDLPNALKKTSLDDIVERFQQLQLRMKKGAANV